jgi:hypothetical protein
VDNEFRHAMNLGGSGDAGNAISPRALSDFERISYRVIQVGGATGRVGYSSPSIVIISRPRASPMRK